ncbi:hypothetical protein [Deinococcus fonticola]|uniref:hypothetical protein n=1 Tax=Deinococcus fonticola TaxID=2528713 RepID=UPI0010752C55|nr:hypothetical protein [Deinococcus fonticola]
MKRPFYATCPLPAALLAGVTLGCLTACNLFRQQDPLAAAVPEAVTQLKKGLPTVATHRTDGTILVNGQPFFPLGFYHVSWARNGTPERRQQDLSRLAGAGFNFVITEGINELDAANFQSFLKQAQESGVFVMPYGLTPENRRKISASPALLGFKIADDANAQLTPQQVEARNEQFKKATPNKLTYLSLAVAQNRPETPYFSTADLIGNQSYPIGNDDISVTYPMMRSAVQSAHLKGTVPIANLQSFLWGRRKPSPVELRNMTYQAIMAGMKGVVYYAYRAREVDLNQEPVMWSTLQGVAHEVSFLAPYLLSGELMPLQDGTGSQPLVVYLRGESQEGQKKGFVMALNSSRTADRLVNLKLPEPPTQWKPISTLGRTLNRRGLEVSGRLRPLQVAIYEVK